MNYYNDNEKFVCRWLRNLIADGLIPDGDVDDRPIQEVQPDDLETYTQCHFFAGIGGWAYALELAGWPTDRPVWTGSCPCQPFSAAGKRGAERDERHLWPEFHRLITHARPPTVFGEQVSGPDGLAWFGAVRADLDTAGYSVGGADLCAASVGAPHIRQRLYWVADSECGSTERHGYQLDATARAGSEKDSERERVRADTGDGGGIGDGLADADGKQCGWHAPDYCQTQQDAAIRDSVDAESGRCCGVRDGLGDTEEQRNGAHAIAGSDQQGQAIGRECEPGGSGPWDDIEWVRCVEPDGRGGTVERIRPTQPGIKPLAHGVSGRVGKLRAYGNAIVPQVAAEFVTAFIETKGVAT